MAVKHHTLLLLFLAILPLSSTSNHHHRTLLQTDNIPCPLNFALVRGLVNSNYPSLDVPNACRYAQQGLHLAQADYLRRTNSFVPPLNTTNSCWRSFHSFVQDFYPNINLNQNCGFDTNLITTPGCMNITNRQQFETTVNGSLLNPVLSTCNQSIMGSHCSSCTVALSNLQASYLNGYSVGNLTDCRAYPFIYAAAFINRLGPTDRSAPICLFAIDTSMDTTKSKNKHKTILIVIVPVLLMFIALLVICIGILYHWRKKLNRNRTRSNVVSALDAISESTTLVKYTIDDIKEATSNFSSENIIGRGGFGNVYRGVLRDDSEVALKRFKNCSAAGDESFTHEVEVIASVRHVNLVALRGYCTATTPFEGYQRVIVTDLVKNGSLHDHLFGKQLRRDKLSWPTRRNIALGMARGRAGNWVPDKTRFDLFD